MIRSTDFTRPQLDISPRMQIPTNGPAKIGSVNSARSKEYLVIETIGVTDLRRWERQPAAIPVSLVLDSEELQSDTFTATLDISVSGIAVQTMLSLAPKQEVGVVFTGDFTQTLRARVIWVRRDESSNSTIAGLKFLLY